MSPEDLNTALQITKAVLRLIPHITKALKELTPLIKSVLHRLRKKP